MQTLIALEIETQTLTFDLADPQMTLMHRAGLAGLYMTLRQLDRENQNFQHNSQIPLQWNLDQRSITLSWQGKALDTLKWLFEQSFQLQGDMISLRGLDAKQMPPQYLAIAHQGILGTLLQHNSTHKSIGVQTKIYYEDEESYPIIIRYKALKSYVYQEFAENLCDKNGNLSTKPISIAGWLNLGAAVRHTAFSSDTSFQEPAHLALILLFAPVACCYFVLRSRLREQRAQYALVIPEIRNLEKYARYRISLRNRAFKEFFASSLGDAGLQFLTMAEKLAKDYDIPACQVITMGTVAWSTQQKTRTDLYLVNIGEASKVLQNYRVSRECLQDRIIARDKEENSFIAISLARELIADNLARGKPWHAELSNKITSSDLFEKLNYEREGLNQMIQSKKIEWSKEERLFVKAFHEALRNTYGQQSERTKEDEKIRLDKVNQKFRTKLMRCKNRNSVREFVMDFWARAGRLPTVQDNWEEFMRLMTDDWKAARDLALLALVSYKGRDNSGYNGSTTQESEDSEVSSQIEHEPKTAPIPKGFTNVDFDEEED
ncbi:type I-MYXAN CRISPR-associated Cas8a1/Cmx1 [Pseudanabaena sp. UWO311]|uniref:type I-MYXAN CRISPR-associated Cas8a1/Cmx1 n=1 Tax=Pseudanabaena sp. UWO311 TaxID=2487337 RepID=UPI00115724C8|nr:type I-MYXAN CRISPR-associated Cas8a1/Cmx1 [Pseudanabaena sp. UWO311]TYQ27636.1 type I-MYXAN CRISPR-associated Cas8a1/Cmx1 [Pseudanabaena sp. UWO311]